MCHSVRRLCESSDLTIITIVERWIAHLPMDWDRISNNTHVSVFELLAFPELPLNPAILSLRPDITCQVMKFCRSDMAPYLRRLFDWNLVPLNLAIPAEFLATNQWLPYNRASFALRDDVTYNLCAACGMLDAIVHFVDVERLPRDFFDTRARKHPFRRLLHVPYTPW
jgi:hypothetical protein